MITRFEDNFDGGDCGQWQLVGDWGCEAGALSDSVGGDYPYNYRASAVVGVPLSFEGTQAVEVSFDLAALVYEPDRDFLFFQYSLDGTSWRTIDRYTGSDPGPRAYDLEPLAGMPSVYFRFQSLTDYGIQYDGALIDDFHVDVVEAVTCVVDLDCDDMNSCTVDTCDSVMGCIYEPDPTCDDADADGVGDPEDNCADVPNGPYGGTCVVGLVGAPCAGDDDCVAPEQGGLCSMGQEDLDGDGSGDACDPDQDGDGIEAAAGDCDDRSDAVYPGAPEICDGMDNDCDGDTDNAPPPADVTTLNLEDEILSWDPVPDATGYDVVRGDLMVLVELGMAASVTGCLYDDVPSDWAIDDEGPPPDDGYWYLVRSGNCGGSSSYGDGDPGLLETRDEAIAASGLDCAP
jgi:hypothetical protein